MPTIDGQYTTNYRNTLILPAADCPAPAAQVPPKPDGVAGLQYAALAKEPYGMTSDDLISSITAHRKGVPNDAAFRTGLFSRGQPCLRASPLAKTHGWAFHHDADARVRLVDPGTETFRALLADDAVAKTPAMRNRRA